MIGIQPPRPPFVEFKQIAVHDKLASEEKGYRVMKNVDFAWIMQPGSKDRVEIKATDWLDSLKRKALDGAPDAYPQDWIDAFHSKFSAWKSGHEAPLNGTSVREWPILSPAQAENFIALRVATIEDVAAMTEECMARVGMGARELRDKARDWLKGADISKATAQENVELRQRVAELESLVKQMLETSDKQPGEAEPKRRGRPPKLQKAA